MKRSQMSPIEFAHSLPHDMSDSDAMSAMVRFMEDPVNAEPRRKNAPSLTKKIWKDVKLFLLLAIPALLVGWAISQIGAAHSTELGVREDRVWSYCYKQEDAVQIANLYFDAGFDIASSAWNKAMELKECGYGPEKMTPLEEMWSRSGGPDKISVVRLLRESGDEVFWFRLESQ